MHRRTTATLALALLAATALAGCTSGEDDPEPSTAAPTTEGAAPANPNWFCRLIESETVDLATGGRAEQAREMEVLSTEDEYQCDVIVPGEDGEAEVAMSLSTHRNVPGLADELLGEVQGLEGVVEGPDHLGVSYVADTLAVSVVPCKPEPNGDKNAPEVPYVFMLRAQLDADGAATESLVEPLTRMVREMDQSYGCSPSKIHPVDQDSQTGAPGDDTQGTTAP